MTKKNIAIAHIVVAILFAGLITIVARVRGNNDLTNWILVVYMVPFMYLSILNIKKK